MNSKKIFVIVSAAMLSIASFHSSAFDIKGMLGKVKGEDVASTVEGMVEGVVSQNSSISPADLKGSWTYVSPAVTFKSDDLVKQIGGSAASTTVEKKLATYYKKLGVDQLQMTVDDDLNFVMKIKGTDIKGKIAPELTKDGMLTFNFAAFKKVPLGKLNAKASKAANKVNLTFDVSQLLAMAKKVSSLAGDSSVKALGSVLESYDGMLAGVKLQK